MARTVNNADERIARIKEVGDYFFKTGDSTKQIAKHFTENRFEISNYTVSQYIKEYMEMFPDRKEKIREKITDNTPLTIEDSLVVGRVIHVAKAYLKDYTLEEIAESLGVSVNVVFDDLHSRLERIDNPEQYFKLEEGETLSEMIKKKSKERQVANLKRPKK